MAEQTMTLPLTVRAQYVKKHTFNNPDPIASFTQNTDKQPNIAVNIQVHADNLGSSNFEVVLDIGVEAKRDDHSLFTMDLSYAAVVSVEGVSEENTAPFVMIEAPHLIFPFARNIISDATREGGFPPLLLAPVDFAALYSQQQDAKSQESSGKENKKSSK